MTGECRQRRCREEIHLGQLFMLIALDEQVIE